MSNPEIELKVELTPVVRRDPKTGQFVAKFDLFPRAIAVGYSEEEATKELLSIFSIMAEEREEDIRKVIVEKYYERNGGRHQVLKTVKVFA